MAMQLFSRINSASISARRTTGSRFARAGALSYDDYLGADHVDVQPAGIGQPTLEAWFLKQRGIERRVEVRTFSFVAAPFRYWAPTASPPCSGAWPGWRSSSCR